MLEAADADNEIKRHFGAHDNVIMMTKCKEKGEVNM